MRFLIQGLFGIATGEGIDSLWWEQAENSSARLIPQCGTTDLLLHQFDATGGEPNVN
jgi:hypothetical protein